MPIFSIIGSSGREETIDNTTFNRAILSTVDYINKLNIPISEITLQSGGSSGMDHIAVILFLHAQEYFPKQEFKGLILHFPCGFDYKNCGGFYSLNKYDIRASELLTELHQKFSNVIKRDTLGDIHSVLQLSKCNSDTDFGFFKRNNKVANCDILLALTLGKSINGGTNDTWEKSQAKVNYHIVITP